MGIGLRLLPAAGAAALLAASVPGYDRELDQDVRSLIGLSVASHVASIAPEQSGRIIDVPVEDGEKVEKDAVLVRLSSRLQELEVERLASLVKSNVSMTQAKAGLQHAKKRAGRVRELRNAEISSDAQFQDQNYEVEVAQLRLDQTALDHAQLNNEYKQAQARLDQRTLRSPIDGIVTRTFKLAGDSIEKFVPVLEVMRLDPMWIEFDCPVSDEHLFQVGTHIEVAPTVRRHEVRSAKIIHTSMRADPSSHTFVVRAAVPNKDHSWKAGLKMVITRRANSDQASPKPGK